VFLFQNQKAAEATVFIIYGLIVIPKNVFMNCCKHMCQTRFISLAFGSDRSFNIFKHIMIISSR